MDSVIERALELFSTVREGAPYFDDSISRATLDGYIMSTFEALGLSEIAGALRNTYQVLDDQLV